jgi:hypothetical protein
MNASDEPSQEASEQQEADDSPSLWERAKQGFGKVADVGADVVSGAVEQANTAGGFIATKTGLDRAVDYIDDQLDESGVKHVVGSTYEAVTDRLDQVTGKQLVELLQDRLKLQDQYNDVLATRLAEALNRIAALEEKVGK